MQRSTPGTRDIDFVCAAAFLIGTAGMLYSLDRTTPWNPNWRDSSTRRTGTEYCLVPPADPSALVDPRLVLSKRTPRSLPSRTILVFAEGVDSIPFDTDPRLENWTKDGVRFPLAVRVSTSLSADISAMASGFGVLSSSTDLTQSTSHPRVRTMRGWSHGYLKTTEDLSVLGSSSLPCPVGDPDCVTNVLLGSETDSDALSREVVLRQIRAGSFDADLCYLEYYQHEWDTIELLTALRDSLDRLGQWHDAFIVVAGRLYENPAHSDDTTRERVGSESVSLFVKFPRNEFAGRVSALTVSSYDVGNSLREHFGQPVAMESLSTMLRDEGRYRTRFVFGGVAGAGLRWVRAGRFEYDVALHQVFEVASGELAPGASELVQSFERQAKTLVSLWPTKIDRGLFGGSCRTLEGAWWWLGRFEPIDPVAGNPSHFIYK